MSKDTQEISERHEVRLRTRDHTIIFSADSDDGRLTIRQEFEGRKQKRVCEITLADPSELRAFFTGLRKILASLGQAPDSPVESRQTPSLETSQSSDDREVIMERARQRNPQAFAPWTREEEQEVRRRYEAGEDIDSIARARKRSPRAIELRLQRLGLRGR